MNSSDEIRGFGEAVDRVLESTKEEQEHIEKRENSLKEREEILRLLKMAGEEIEKLKKTTVKKDEMVKFFDEFLNEFSHVVDGIEDTKTKGVFSRFIEETRKLTDAFKTW